MGFREYYKFELDYKQFNFIKRIVRKELLKEHSSVDEIEFLQKLETTLNTIEYNSEYELNRDELLSNYREYD